MTDIAQAINALAPNCNFGVGNDSLDEIDWHEGNPLPQPSDEDILAKRTELQAEATANQYKEFRKQEYPEWSVQLEKIYDDGVDKWKSEMVDPVKTKWPKDNSGPVE